MKKTNKIAHSNDKLFKTFMHTKVAAIDFLTRYLDESVQKVFDFSTLTVIPNDHISEQFNNVFCDVVFNCQYKDKSLGDAKIIVLVEHQSTPDMFMPIRINRYIYSMLDNEIKARQTNRDAPLSAVYCLLFYNGLPKTYPHPLTVKDCLFDPHNVSDRFLSNEIHLVNIHDYSDDELTQQKLEGMMGFALKHQKDKELDKAIYKFIDFVMTMDTSDNLVLQLFQMSLKTLFDKNTIDDPDKFIDYANQLPNQIKGEVMTAAEQLQDWLKTEFINEGVEKGIDIGVEKGIDIGVEKGIDIGVEQGYNQCAIKALQKGADVEFVAGITDLTIEQVRALKDELEKDS